MFKIPEKQIIVNSDDQVRLLEDDGSAYTAADVTPSAGGFILEGFSQLINGSDVALLSSATRIIKNTPSAGVAEATAFAPTVTASLPKGTVFRVTTESLDKTPTEFQNWPKVEKRYQLGVACANAAALIDEIVAQINADANAKVIAYKGFNNVTPVQDDSDKIVLVAKDTGREVELYISSDDASFTRSAVGDTVYHTAEDTSITVANATLPVNTYDDLKNINWSKNLDVDRNIEYFPEKGAQYNSYYFEADFTSKDIGGHVVPSQVPISGRVAFRLWVKTGLTLDTALDALATDLNV